MKKLLLAAVALVALAAGPAVAADLGRKAPAYIPPPAPPPPSFTGCYVNGGAGYGLYNIDHFGEEDGTTATSTVTSGGPVGSARSAAVATISSRPAVGPWARSPITTSWTCTGISRAPSLTT